MWCCNWRSIFWQFDDTMPLSSECTGPTTAMQKCWVLHTGEGGERTTINIPTRHLNFQHGYFAWTARCWRLRHCVLLKCQWILHQEHCITSQKTWTLVNNTVVRTSNSINFALVVCQMWQIFKHCRNSKLYRNPFRISGLFHCFSLHFDSLSFIHTNSCTFSYNHISVF